VYLLIPALPKSPRSPATFPTVFGISPKNWWSLNGLLLLLPTAVSHVSVDLEAIGVYRIAESKAINKPHKLFIVVIGVRIDVSEIKNSRCDFLPGI
jgi:hypothetical protein